MENNIDEANIAGSRPRPRGKDRIQPGEGSRNPGRRILKPQPQSEDPDNRKLARQGGTQESKESRTGPSREWNALVRPTQQTQSSGGGITYISRPKEQEASPTEKPEVKQTPKTPTTVGSKPISIPNSTQSQRKDRKSYLLQQKEKRKSGIQNKPESKKLTPDEVDIIKTAFPRGSRKKPIDLTHKGKKLKPGGKAANTKISTARREGSKTRIARGKARREIIREFIDNYRKSIL